MIQLLQSNETEIATSYPGVGSFRPRPLSVLVVFVVIVPSLVSGLSCLVSCLWSLVSRLSSLLSSSLVSTLSSLLSPLSSLLSSLVSRSLVSCLSFLMSRFLSLISRLSSLTPRLSSLVSLPSSLVSRFWVSRSPVSRSLGLLVSRSSVSRPLGLSASLVVCVSGTANYSFQTVQNYLFVTSQQKHDQSSCFKIRRRVGGSGGSPYIRLIPSRNSRPASRVTVLPGLPQPCSAQDKCQKESPGDVQPYYFISDQSGRRTMPTSRWELLLKLL